MISKKAQIQMGIKPIIGIILAVIVILATVVVFVALIGVFVGNTDQETESLYNAFLGAAGTLANDKVPDGTACYLRASISKDWMLLMFDAKEPTLEQRCGGNEAVEKPDACGGTKATKKGCFCVCDVGGSGADDNDCKEKGAKCHKVDYFKAFWYPDHDKFENDEWTWWSDDVDSWTTGGSTGDGQVYGQDCGGTVWSEGPNTYILKKSGTDLIVRRLPKGTDSPKAPKTSTGRLKSLDQPLKPCRRLADELKQTSKGGVSSAITQ
ncbi:MAG: hypothetical protein ACE5DM_00820 [Candidatus Nanoarchaeia archaeon]